jgi:signal transduction histidine kinase
LTIRSRNEDGGNVLVEVEDCGKGLAADEADRIFDAFFSTKSGGLGMGLSVSRSIVEMHGGRIAAVPNNGPGVTLQVSLPAAPVAS